jgi:hypothetical protein
MRKKILLLALLIVAAFSVGILARNAQSAKRHVPYTIVWQVTSYDERGKATPAFVETRYVSASGSWRSIKRFPDGRVAEMFCDVGRGTFNYSPGQQRLTFMSDCQPRQIMSVDEWRQTLRQSPQFTDVETVAGQEAYLMTVGDRLKVYRSPALNGEDIKVIFLLNGKTSSVFEPISLTMGEPDAAMLQHVDLPVDYAPYQKKQEALKGRQP